MSIQGVQDLEGFELTEDHATNLYKKIEGVNSSISEMNKTLGQMQVSLSFLGEDNDRLDRLITRLDHMLYGKNGESPGVLTRLIQLEKAQADREKINWIFYALVLGIIAEAVGRYLFH